MEEIRNTVKAYILEVFLPGTNPAELTDSTPLITGGIVDSLAALQLVTFLEEQYEIEVQAHEVSVDYLDTIDDIANFIHSKV